MHGSGRRRGECLHRPAEGRPRQKRSLVRMLVMTVIGGLMAVPLAGYAFCGLGAGGGFPGSGQVFAASNASRVVQNQRRDKCRGSTAAGRRRPTKRPLPTRPKPRPPRRQRPTKRPMTPIQREAASKVTETPAEKLATFNEPLDAKKPAEPAAFDAPPAAPLKDSADIGEPIQITDAPSFTVADLVGRARSRQERRAGIGHRQLWRQP